MIKMKFSFILIKIWNDKRFTINTIVESEKNMIKIHTNKNYVCIVKRIHPHPRLSYVSLLATTVFWVFFLIRILNKQLHYVTKNTNICNFSNTIKLHPVYNAHN